MSRLLKNLGTFLWSLLKYFKRPVISAPVAVKEKEPELNVLLPVINSPGRYIFFCPGCMMNHVIDTTPTNERAYHVLTGSLSSPTIKASVLSNPNNLAGRPRCHSFITDGVIDFLNDCTHDLAGQKVKLPPI
ncbi:MAG: DUF6527 family protein [Sphingobacteriales bacterium]